MKRVNLIDFADLLFCPEKLTYKTKMLKEYYWLSLNKKILKNLQYNLNEKK